MARFNPRTGEWEGLEPPRLSTTSTGSAVASGSGREPTWEFEHQQESRSAYSRFNRWVANIGEAIANFADNGREVLNGIFTFLFIGAGIVGLILLAVHGHWIMAIIIGLLCGSLFVSFSAIVSAVLSWLIFVPLALLRYLFYNAWTLIIGGVVLLTTVSGFYQSYNFNNSHNSEEVEAVPVLTPEGDIMYCTASSLVLRSGPSTASKACGSLEHGEPVEVIEHNAGNGFSKVSVLGHEFYVSSRYLSSNAPD